MANKNIILDTTYVLPLFGIDISLNKSSINEIKELWKHGLKDCSIYIPYACLIEVIFKLNREFRHKPDINILNRYSLIFPTIQTSSIVKMFDCFMDVTTSQTATKIREKGHDDVMDCWIASSAVTLQGTLISEDDTLKKILDQIPEFTNIPILSWVEFKKQFGI
jgi:hypothetical protein